MPLSARRWNQFAESQFAHEREALEFLRDILPDRDPIFLYSNFEFIADDGSVNEIDTLVVTQAGVFLVELKSRGGIVTGNRHLWDWEKDGRTITVDSPLVLANSKARKLASLLDKQRVFRGDRAPWIEALVFLSAPGISVRLPESERMRVCEREPRDKRAGILPALLQRDYYGNESARRPQIDLSAARRVAKALDEAGIRPSQRQRRVGDYVLQELIEENPLFAYQDFKAEHPTTKTTRRVRLYTVAGKDKATRESVRRAALQEFQILESLDHPGILRALDFNEHELGPAILFRREPDELRLDHYLRQRGTTLTLDIRLSLVRQITDAVRYAHTHRVVHRTLSPKSILVVHPDSDRPEVRLFNWQAGRVLATSSNSGSPSSRTSTLHPSQYSEESTLVYLAPESVLDPRGRDPMADVFSLGAIAFHVFSGRPPAASATELNQTLSEHKGLPLGAALDGVTPRLQELIREATAPDLLLRTESAADLLAGLDEFEEELTRPPQEAPADPLEAKPGDMLLHSLRVLKRLGGGTNAVALLVQRGDEILVLKYARKAKDSHRIEEEFRTLAELRYQLIVDAKEILSFPDGNSGFLMEYAGEWDRKKEPTKGDEPRRDTLARELKAVGRLSLEFLSRFGEDLLQVVQYLERKGIAHRDLKPDNIGIKEYGKKLHLKVFDFSLSNAPLDNVRVGTPPYLEPFLQLRNRWDTAAERYSAAVILYEMATGITPRWGDGQSAPHLIEAEATIDSDLLEAPVRQGLNDFFRRSFQRNPGNRFDNATDMLIAWQGVFHSASAVDSRLSDPGAQERALQNLRPDTLISQLGLSTRALNTLDRLGILRAEELAAEAPGKFSNLRGVGNKTRREIMDLTGKLRTKLPQPAIPGRSAAPPSTPETSRDEASGPMSVDALTSLLIPVESSQSGKVSHKILAAFLELEDSATGVPQYPTQSQIAEKLGKSRAYVGQIITKGRDRWRRSIPALTPVRTELAEFLEAEGGVAQIGELAQYLLTSRGSDVTEPLARYRAAAVVRASIEAEKLSESCRFEERRHGNVFLVARSETPFGESALDYAEALGKVAGTLAESDPLPSPSRVLDALRAVPSTTPALREDRLVRLAAAAAHVAVSPRLEIYPKNLDALRALKLAQSAIAGVIRSITPDELRRLVRDRYPEAQPLPERPSLDRLLSEAGLELTWDNSKSEYFAPQAPVVASSASLHRFETVITPRLTSYVAPVELPRDMEDAVEFERRLRAAYASPSYLVLATGPKLKYLELAKQNIERHFPMTVLNCEQEFLAALKREAESKGIRWDVVLRADASKPEGDGTTSRDWDKLRTLAANAAVRVAGTIQSRSKSMLLTYPGLLARYGQLSILDDLADSLGDHSLWLLAGSEHQAASPMIDGEAIPARPTQWAWIPLKWLDNEFRKFKGGTAH
ncbi:BREX system serine/threonine kinase PglW [Tunturiibacter gelidoferens]|uniref:Serine/threonine protein kinase n=1 Tax=Tunturiibacter lichenicola TaxID=2051959 RepID=A0A7Y9NR68_9BACT|nr:BREX system serine/threonine kinase PglW [Edaphobacter lichenicola]NYF54063.1 serine/threonine protein kinase [Edaphobacter lichenicola]